MPKNLKITENKVDRPLSWDIRSVSVRGIFLIALIACGRSLYLMLMLLILFLMISTGFRRDHVAEKVDSSG